jgi:hypothetical protein
MLLLGPQPVLQISPPRVEELLGLGLESQERPRLRRQVLRNRGRLQEMILMKNVQIMDDTLAIQVDVSKEFGPSSSGKTIIIASTEGSISVPDREEKIELNV